MDEKDKNIGEEKPISKNADESEMKEFRLITEEDIKEYRNIVKDDPELGVEYMEDDDRTEENKKSKKQKKEKETGLHDGHRDRMRNKIRKNGIRSLEDHEVLEYVLFHLIPRKDTNALAHTLINEFGCLYDVLSADEARLNCIPGLTANAALFLSQFVEIFDIAHISRIQDPIHIYNKKDLIYYVAPRIAKSRYERLIIVFLDINNKVIGEKVFTNYCQKSVTVKRKQLIVAATSAYASKVIIAHNHPGGTCYPSREDVDEFYKLQETFKSIGIELLDSGIITFDKGTTINLINENKEIGKVYYPIRFDPYDIVQSESVIEDIDESLTIDIPSHNSETHETPLEFLENLPEINLEEVGDQWLKDRGLFDI